MTIRFKNLFWWIQRQTPGRVFSENMDIFGGNPVTNIVIFVGDSYVLW